MAEEDTTPTPTPEQHGAEGPAILLHPHTARNVNLLHAAEVAASGINARIALTLTRAVGTMACAYLFALLACIGFPGLHATPAQYVQWVSQTFIQLVMLSVIMVGQGLLSKKQEMQADEQYRTTVKTYHDMEQLARAQEQQGVELARQTTLLQSIQADTSAVRLFHDWPASPCEA